MSPTFQPADLARATGFYATLFVGRGKYEKREAATLEAARAERDELNANVAKNGHRAMVYMMVDGRSDLVPEAFDPANPDATIAEPAKAKKAPKAKAAAKAEPKAKPAKAPKAAKVATAKPASGQRAAVLADAKAGRLPPVPNFEAATHARFRGKLADLVALVEARDVKGLQAYAINPISSSPKALDRYRNLCVIALTGGAGKSGKGVADDGDAIGAMMGRNK